MRYDESQLEILLFGVLLSGASIVVALVFCQWSISKDKEATFGGVFVLFGTHSVRISFEVTITLIKFWNDAWIPSCGRLVDVAASNTPHYELQKSVAEYIDVNGCWQIDTIKDYLSPNVVKMVTDMEVSYNTDRADSKAWRGSLVMECAL